ncbi:Haloacid dehalogenase-like hydrolase domain-containing protein 3 [Wallemia ichthyophaga EXF-994]|uniref:Haloacid dehalogenase-like hydrolase domain-containing protein 3 n=1 Tax=Wallemia ichthyophaga (strain EXF-994 / CBS 113033) TaxID=1299270 RepID=R9API6_WALI9|nr:Haloacid dehalogenase-like hydrolase domain-containing protein 3 [Wallemia ichthyophaga EXF-994]EOR04134.1 Haloacid dehalogenase-like hydrolase domain-containing protein 3 [Wallemia ichthyophaga EXF-994]
MKAATTTRMVLFDAFDTILRPRQPIPNQYAHVFHKHGININPDVIKSSFKVAFVQLNEKASNYGKSIAWTPNQWWSTLIRMVIEDNVSVADINNTSLQVIQNELLTRFASSEGYEPFEGSYETLSSIKKSGLKCGLVSNSDERIVSVLESLHLRHFFDKISLSYNVGCEKPDINIFKHALHSNIRPEEVLFVGDEYKADYLGAMHAGMHPLLFYRAEYHKPLQQDVLSNINYVQNIPDVLSYIKT